MKRYDMYDFNHKQCPSEMMPHKNGNWVKYEDVIEKVKLFPIGPDNKQGKLFRDIIQVLVNYRSDKHADVMAHQYSVEIMKLSDKFANELGENDEKL